MHIFIDICYIIIIIIIIIWKVQEKKHKIEVYYIFNGYVY